MNELRQAGLLIKEDIKESLRSMRVVLVLLMYALMYVIVVLITTEMQRSVNNVVAVSVAQEAVLDSLSKTEFFGLPLQLLIPYYLLILVLPFVILVISYRSISGEMHDNTIINLFLAVKKRTIFISKFIGIFIVVNLTTFLLFVGNSIYSHFRIGGFDIYGPCRVFLYLAAFSIPCIAVIMAISSLVKNPPQTLLVSFVILLLMLFLALTRLRALSIFSYVSSSVKFAGSSDSFVGFIGLVYGFLIYALFALLAGYISFRGYEP